MYFLRLLLAVSLALLAKASPVSDLTKTTPPMYPDARRRGIAYNNPGFVHHFDVHDSGVGWCYNWYPRSEGTNTPFEYVPMLWSDAEDQTSIWWEAVQRAANAQINDPTHLLGFNEPDNCQNGAGGSCMSIGSAVAAWKQHMEPAKTLKEKMYLGSPAVTNGGGSMGLNWLSDFMNACTGCNIDFICIHWYDSATNIPYFKKHINDARKIAAGRPIWITEFSPRGTDDEIKNFLNEVVPWMDASADIHRYAYFMAREGYLVNAQGNGMSDIGWHYSTLQSGRSTKQN